jgi:methionyl-tRNA formyltransferase
MTRRALSIVLAAGESAGVSLLRALADTPHRVAGVVAAAGAAPTLGPSVADAARGAGLDVLPANRVADPAFPAWLRARKADLLLAVRFPRIIPAAALAVPRVGAFNLHTGPLPEYAGRNVVSHAIANGETEHAVTLHRMTADIDAGDVVLERRFAIGTDDTALAVTATCVRLGIPLCLELLRRAARDPAALPGRPQDPARRRVWPAAPPGEGRIEWQWPARRVVDFVRACDYGPYPSPWGRARARVKGREVSVSHAAHTGRPAALPPGTARRDGDGPVWLVACCDSWVAVRVDPTPPK